MKHAKDMTEAERAETLAALKREHRAEPPPSPADPELKKAKDMTPDERASFFAGPQTAIRTMSNRLHFTITALLFLAASSPAFAQQLPPDYLGRTGGVTTEVCVTPVVTAGAYSAGNVVGGLITLPTAFITANSGVLQSIQLTVKSVQAAEFDVTLFSAQPSAASTFNDHAAPAIAAADVPLAQPPVRLITSFSGLVATVYGADNIGRGLKGIGSTLYAMITTPGAPTFASTSDVQLCVGLSQD